MRTTTIEVTGNDAVPGGTVVLRSPRAGERNKKCIETGFSGTVTESNQKEFMQFLVELLPCCVQSHPWMSKPLKESLDNLDTWEYDELVGEFVKLMAPPKDLKKKSKDASDASNGESDGKSA